MPERQQTIAELRRELDKARAQLTARNSAYSERIAYQSATNDVLKVMSTSPGNPQPVFDLISARARDLCDAYGVTVYEFDGSLLHWRAATGVSDDPAIRESAKKAYPSPPSRHLLPNRAILNRAIVHVRDHDADTELHRISFAVKSSIVVPMMRGITPIGALHMGSREYGGFSDAQVQLLETFADQAVIAIENARLFNEVQTRTVELTEALEQQTATAEVLGVISSSAGDLAPVFDAMLGKAMELCGANFGVLSTFDGSRVHTEATYGLPPAYEEYRRSRTLEYGPGTGLYRLMQGEPFVELEDLLGSEPYVRGDPNRRALVDLGRARCLLAVPLLKDDRIVGFVMIFRQERKRFSEKQITLLQQFAAQAVIAIENTRLLRELRESTEDLSESLQQQTATSEVLQVISSSPGDLAPVFDKMLENATRVCGAEFGSMSLVEGDKVRQAALYNAPPAFAAARANRVFQINPRSSIGAAIRTKQVVHVEDLRQAPGYLERNPSSVELAELGGARTIVVVPMLRDDEAIGQITVYRQEVRPFSEKQIDLLRNFARQAVIAIENARLLRELRQRTDDLAESLQFQTATSDVLKVISRSPDALQPVFDVIVETSRELCHAQASTIFTLSDGRFYVVAFAGEQTEVLQHMRDHPIAFEQRGSALARAARERRTIHVPNTYEDPEFAKGNVIGIGEPRATLTVPLMHEGKVIGGITLRQSRATPFTPRQIQAIETFADQAVIAISNVGLFEQVQERTRELSKSLDDLRTAQDRLVQTEKLASLGQLTAGIAHEIKNPLNFVNNFSALSVELTDELKEVLTQERLTEKGREETDELTGLLKDNLSKVVQHGKRADSIVKNMLLHSREGSGERRSADVNALVGESLNLAYHGARAEKAGFTITLKHDLDPEAGAVDLYPQEITRALLNLISNGFYAATRRKIEAGDETFEPVLSAATRNLGKTVEIRIRDNGAGIPPDIQEKIFNPFFTTKPAGEGTGLGLSMSHDIVVKQHGGTIEVVTEPGSFTEFIITLPRIMPA